MAAAVRSMAGRMGRTNEEKEALQEDIMQAILEVDRPTAPPHTSTHLHTPALNPEQQL